MLCEVVGKSIESLIMTNYHVYIKANTPNYKGVNSFQKGVITMNKATHRFEGLSEKRMLSIDEACFYTGMGKTVCRKWLNEIGATKKIGKRVICDREVIDRALDSMTA